MDIDVVSFVDYLSIDEVLEKHDVRVRETKGHLRIAGVKVISDGTLTSGAYLSRPFENSEDDYGLQYISYEGLKEVIGKAVQSDWRFCVHAMGDAAVEKVLDVYEEVLAEEGREPFGDFQNILNHSSAIRKDQLPRVASLGVGLSLYPSAASKLIELFSITIGEDRASAANPVRSAIENGILVSAHMDTPVIEANPLIIVWAAAGRKSVATGQVFDEDETVSVLDALRLTTINSAKQYGIDDKVGSIAAGKQADLVILDRNPLKTEIDEIGKIRVLQTFKNGKSVYENYESKEAK
jgi:predicted amidohydrolase YtcJ